MRKVVKQLMVGALMIGLAMPTAALAADQELEKKIDALSKEIDVLKQQVKKTEDKSLGRWLTIGGDYRFRVDSLRGESKPYVDVNATFNNAQQQMSNGFFADPVANGPQVAAFMNFANSMKQVSTFSGAQTFLGNNMAMLGGAGGLRPAGTGRQTEERHPVHQQDRSRSPRQGNPECDGQRPPAYVQKNRDAPPILEKI